MYAGKFTGVNALKAGVAASLFAVGDARVHARVRLTWVAARVRERLSKGG